MKQLVETTGQFELVDFENGTIIQADRPTVVVPTTFTSARAALGQVRFLANLKDEATDEEFAEYVKQTPDDIDFAIEAFKSAFSPEEGSSKRKSEPKETEDLTPAPTRKPRQAKAGGVKDEELPEPDISAAFDPAIKE